MADIALIRRSVSTAIIAKPFKTRGIRSFSVYCTNQVIVPGQKNVLALPLPFPFTLGNAR
jgi:hypothetical protein